MKLLIVDDSSLMRNRIVNQALKIDGINIVGEAENGVSALEKFDKHNPDFIILDIHLPGINGLEVLRQIRTMNTTATLCMLTNFDLPQYKEYSFKHGADFFLSKADDFDKLKTILAEEVVKHEQAESREQGA